MSDIRLEDIENLVKIDGLYFKYCNEWTQRHFGHQTYEKGDCLYMTARKIIEDNDTTPWAYDALMNISDLLREGKRWPDSYNSYLDASNWVQYQLSYLRFKIIYRFKKPYPVFRLYRTQRGLTRDPIILHACLAVHLNRIQFIESVDPPLRLFRLSIFLWRKALITGMRSKLYEFLERKPNHKDDYVNLLRYYRQQAYQTRTK